jgi:hypothetical protein
MIPHSVKHAAEAVALQSRIEKKEQKGAGAYITKLVLAGIISI